MQENDQPIELPIDGILDLHSFHPKEVKSLLHEYIAVCKEKGIYNLRIIHGKGKGILRDRVRAILQEHPSVISFRTATDSSSWGATLVEIS